MNRQLEDADPRQIEPVSLVAQSGALLLGRGAAMFFSFAVPLVLVRVLDQSVFGEYKQYFLIAITVVQMAALGLPWSIYYFVPGGGERRGESVGAILLVLSVIGVVVLGVGVSVGHVLGTWMNSPELGSVMPHLAGYTALMLVTQFAEDLAVVERHPRAAAIVVFGSELLRTGLLVGAVLIWGTLSAIAWASVSYAGFRALFVIAYSLKLFGRTLFTTNTETFRALLAYAIPLGLAVPLQAGQTYLHQYFVAAVTDPFTFALYAVGCFQIPVVRVAYTAIADVALVRTAELSKDGDVVEMRRIFSSVLRTLGVFFIPIYVFAALFAGSIIEVLFTAQYRGAAPIFIIFSLSIFGSPVDHVVLRAHAQTRFILVANGTGLLVSGLLLVLLYSYLGLMGAAMSYILGLTEFVQLVGVVNDVPAFLRTTDIVVLPSIANEGAPNAIMEAMAAGKPVVATTVGGTPDVVDDGVNGILVEPSNATALAEGIERLFRDRDLRLSMGNAAQAKAAAAFSVERMGNDFHDLYQSHLDRSRCP